MGEGAASGDQVSQSQGSQSQGSQSASDGTETEPVRVSLFDAVGGAPFFEAVVDHFYDGVVDDPVLRPMYPEDLGDARRHTTLFLIQYWGGPGTYSEERGHPRLRMRHLPFVIGEAERDAWLARMMAGVDAALSAPPAGSLLDHPSEGPAIAESARSMFANYFEQASTAMINQP